MSLIAASKMRRAQNSVTQGRPYAEKIQEVIAHLAAQPSDETTAAHALLEHRPVQRVGVLVVSPDRGLCGGMQANLNRDLQDNFNPEVGFVPRTGIQLKKIHFEYNPRPDRFGIRVLEPMINGVFTEDQNGRLLTRQIHNMLGIRFQNGARVVLWYNDWFERLEQPFTVVRRPDEDGGDVVVEAGRYKFGDWRFSLNSNPARRVYGNVSYGPRGFFSGTRKDTNLTLGTRLTEQFSAEARYSRNDVEVPGGEFVTSVTSFRIDYAMSPTVSLRTLTQYNSLSEQWSTALRFRYTYLPGSDLYIVYDEVRRDATGFVEIQDRQVILKATYLLSR